MQSFVYVVVSKEKKASRSTIAMTDTRVPILRLHIGLIIGPFHLRSKEFQ